VRQLRVLDQINGAETVAEAVARVNRLTRAPTVSEGAELPGSAGVSDGSAPASPVPGGSPTQAGSNQASPTQQPGAGQAPAERPRALTPRSMSRALSSSVQLPTNLSKGSSGKASPAGWASWKSGADLESCERCCVSKGSQLDGLCGRLSDAPCSTSLVGHEDSWLCPPLPFLPTCACTYHPLKAGLWECA
jgi:hypothetical protein